MKHREARVMTENQETIYDKLVNNRSVDVITKDTKLLFTITPKFGTGIKFYDILVNSKSKRKPILGNEQIYAWVLELDLAE